MTNSFIIKGRFVDIFQQKIYPAAISVENGIIASVTDLSASHHNMDEALSYLLPGFTDAHVHIESSMLIPSEFARLAVVHGTVATVSDPHEIANVCGIRGVQYMIENGKTVPFKFNFGAPSCVPATAFETAGAAIDADEIAQLLQSPDIKYLAEMMNFPGVLNDDSEVMKKIAAAHLAGKPVDGHAPGLRGHDAKKYIDAGITTDHECFTADEALDKLRYGMKILVREGSAAKNFEALVGLMDEHFDQMMFCSDDKHPDSLALGHINQLCARAVAKGIDVFKVLKAACVNPVLHYGLNVGLLRAGDAADFIVVNDLKDFKVEKTFINGQLVAENGVTKIPSQAAGIINHFSCKNKIAEDFAMPASAQSRAIAVIGAIDGQLITNKLMMEPKIENGFYISDTHRDILKIAVVNRYCDAPPAVSFIKNFGLKQGALASTVAHDSHNIIAVGVDDESLCRAVNLVIEARGGIAAVTASEQKLIALPVAGLMSADDGYNISAAYTEIDRMVKTIMGSTLASPFMTVSFMALLVIPKLKLSDKGLFDGEVFQFVSQ